MKLVIAVVGRQDADALSGELSALSIGATKLKSTGGFLRQGSTTFMIGVEDQRLSHTLSAIRKACGTRMEMSPPTLPNELLPPGTLEQPAEIVSGGAIIWVVPMKGFMKL